MTNRTPEVKGFSYTNDMLDELEAALSVARLGTYLEATGQDRQRAICLHVWNTDISAAFYGPLQTLEIALRNAMHRNLGRRYGATWYDHGGAGLDSGALNRVKMVRTEISRNGHEACPPRIVAALSFGFWISLLGSGGRAANGHKANYEMTLWRPALRKAFPHCTVLNRKNAHRPLNDLRILRNRIAHHEPIFARDLAADHDRILEVAGWISPAVRVWIERHSRVPVILRALQDDRVAGF